MSRRRKNLESITKTLCDNEKLRWLKDAQVSTCIKDSGRQTLVLEVKSLAVILSLFSFFLESQRPRIRELSDCSWMADGRKVLVPCCCRDSITTCSLLNNNLPGSLYTRFDLQPPLCLAVEWKLRLKEIHS